MTRASFHAFLNESAEYDGQIASYSFFPPRTGVPAEPTVFQAELARLGIVPWEHQHEALQRLAEGANVAIATGTGSGKSLVFQLPAIASNGTTLALYPTKALAHDQLARFHALGAAHAYTYDGDTPRKKRPHVRNQAQIVLTNPDMLHFGILPFHSYWQAFFRNLTYIVIDEQHAYRGVMGSHAANIIRRTVRVARRYGSNPQLITVSATIGNPREHAEMLCGEPFTLVASDTAPKGAQEFIFWRPPDLDAEGRTRRSANSEAALLAARFARAGIRSLFFCNSRRSAELIRRYAEGHLPPELKTKVQSYRAGYTAEDRRLLETGIKAGDITVLTTTSALELGVDIGGMDAVVLVGYPGSKMALWQRAGRAGRDGQRSLALLIPGMDPLDEYYLAHPELLTEGAIERVTVDPFNTYIHPRHLVAAAAEVPLSPHEELVNGADLHQVPGVFETEAGWRATSRYPQRHIAVRGTGGPQIRIETALGDRLGIADYQLALRELYPGAVYLIQGDAWIVGELNVSERCARLLPHIEEYYTELRSNTDIHIVHAGQALYAGIPLHTGHVRVTEEITGFVKKRYMSEQKLIEEPLDLPAISYDTEAMWFEVPQHIATTFPLEALASAIHALEHTMIGLLPSFVLCERADIGGVSYPHYPPTGAVTVFIYDGYPGGVGYAKGGAEQFTEWVTAAKDLLASCPCRAGCPRCVLSPKCGNGNQYLDKAQALRLAELLLAEGGTLQG